MPAVVVSGPSGTSIHTTPWGKKPGRIGFSCVQRDQSFRVVCVIIGTEAKNETKEAGGLGIPKAQLAHIGGSGTWASVFPEDCHMEGVKVVEKGLEFETPYGTTVPMKLLELDGSVCLDGKTKRVLTVPFHGWHSPDMADGGPEQIFWVFEQAGVRQIVVEGSGGGINHLLDVGDVVIPEDFMDFKKTSTSEFVRGRLIRMRDPLCPTLSQTLHSALQGEGYGRVFRRAVYAVTEGPRFESAAEIRGMKSWGADIVGLTLSPEVYLARAIGACIAGVYIVSNHAEGQVGEWEGGSIYDVYRDCAPKIGRAVLRTLMETDSVKTCACDSYRTEIPKVITRLWDNETEDKKGGN